MELLIRPALALSAAACLLLGSARDAGATISCSGDCTVRCDWTRADGTRTVTTCGGTKYAYADGSGCGCNEKPGCCGSFFSQSPHIKDVAFDLGADVAATVTLKQITANARYQAANISLGVGSDDQGNVVGRLAANAADLFSTAVIESRWLDDVFAGVRARLAGALVDDFKAAAGAAAAYAKAYPILGDPAQGSLTVSYGLAASVQPGKVLAYELDYTDYLPRSVGLAVDTFTAPVQSCGQPVRLLGRAEPLVAPTVAAELGLSGGQADLLLRSTRALAFPTIFPSLPLSKVNGSWCRSLDCITKLICPDGGSECDGKGDNICEGNNPGGQVCCCPPSTL